MKRVGLVEVGAFTMLTTIAAYGGLRAAPVNSLSFECSLVRKMTIERLR